MMSVVSRFSRLSRIEHPSRPIGFERCADRRGAIIVLAAFLMIVLLAMVSFSVDLGYQLTTQTELQRSVDAAALAGAGVLVEGVDQAESRAVEYMVRNPVGKQVIINQENLQSEIAQFLIDHDDEFDIKTGHWDPEAIDPDTGRKGVLVESTERPSTISVSLAETNHPYFFAGILGKSSFSVQAEAIAMYQPREIVIVLDLSGSMSDDSGLKAKNTMGMPAVLANLQQMYTDLGSPSYGNMTSFNTTYISSSNTNTIKKKLGIKYLPYPYPSGSWDDYINYVKNDSKVNSAGYRKKYGGLTLVDYWLRKKPAANQTPNLYLASAQPITSVKDSVDIFFDYLEEVDTDDRVALAVYDAPDGEGKLEVALTDNYDSVKNRSREFQAGHYHMWTNISGGIKTARQHLDSNGRPGSFKMIVLLTDGRPTWANGQSDMSGQYATSYVMSEAQLTANAGYPIVTVSLGSGADTNLMQTVADMTGGTHFNVPGGQSVAEYQEDLTEVFYDIANDRPLKIVR